MDEWITSLESTVSKTAALMQTVVEFKDVAEMVRNRSSEVAKLDAGVNEYVAMVDETKAYMDQQSEILKEARELLKQARSWISWYTDGYVFWHVFCIALC